MKREVAQRAIHALIAARYLAEVPSENLPSRGPDGEMRYGPFILGSSLSNPEAIQVLKAHGLITETVIQQVQEALESGDSGQIGSAVLYLRDDPDQPGQVRYALGKIG